MEKNDADRTLIELLDEARRKLLAAKARAGDEATRADINRLLVELDNLMAQILDH